MDRHQQLARQGLVSQRELELTIQSAIASKADLQGAQANLSAAEQGMKALSFGREQVSAEVLQRLLGRDRDARQAEQSRHSSVLREPGNRIVRGPIVGHHELRGAMAPDRPSERRNSLPEIAKRIQGRYHHGDARFWRLGRQ